MEKENLVTASDSMLGSSGTAFAVGFFFSFRLAVAILSIKLFGADLQTGSEIKLALGFLLLGAACFISFGAATRTLSSILQPSSVRWAMLFIAVSGCSLLWSET